MMTKLSSSSVLSPLKWRELWISILGNKEELGALAYQTSNQTNDYEIINQTKRWQEKKRSRVQKYMPAKEQASDK